MKNKNKKKERTANYLRAVRLLKKAHNINSAIPKGYGVNSSEWEKYYNMKSRLLCKVVGLIREHNLCIKYGTNYGEGGHIAYFEFTENGEVVQVSFHRFYAGKKFNGEWTGIKNLPLHFQKRLPGKHEREEIFEKW